MLGYSVRSSRRGGLRRGDRKLVRREDGERLKAYHRSGTARHRRTLLSLTTGAVLLVGSFAWPFTVDDAFVIFDYADRLADGLGYTRVAGPATDGVTGPLWLVPLVALSVIGLPVHMGAKVMGLATAAISVVVMGRLLLRTHQGSRTLPWFALIIALQSTLGVWGVAGLETGLATLCATLAAAALITRPAPRLGQLGCTIALMAWLRPELALFGGCLLIGVTRHQGRTAIRAWLIAGAGAAALVVIRTIVFGDPFPLSFYAKGAEQPWGVIYALRGTLLTTGLGGVLLIQRAYKLGDWRDRALSISLLAHLIAVILAGGDWMPGARLFAPVIPVYAYLCARGLRGTRRTKLIGVSLALALALPAAQLALDLPRVREAGALREAVARPFAERLGAQYERIALIDAGFLARAGGFEPFDLAGITEPSVAHRAGGHLAKDVPSWMLRDREVDAIVLHSAIPPRADERGRLTHLLGHPVEQAIARDTWVRRNFQVTEELQYHPGYYYVVLSRTDD